MTIALVCPSTLLYMPYICNYEKIFKKNNISYKKINWDRCGIEDHSPLTYRDSKFEHQRSYLDYFKFSKFIIEILKRDKYEKVIIFGLQLTYFLRRYLLKNYKGQYILDIRDYNKVIKLFNVKNIINHSRFTVISSIGYLDWLPKLNKYIVNHNTFVDSIDKLSKIKAQYNYEQITISYIGTLANFYENKDLIDNLKNLENFKLIFYGDGVINTMLEKYVFEEKISNVEISGRYQIEEEERLYSQANLINMILYNKNINDKTCLANRLYKSVLYAKPMIALEGTYLARIISENKLGLVLNSLINIDKNIIDYLENFDEKLYNESRINFLKKVIEINKEFENKILSFVNF